MEFRVANPSDATKLAAFAEEIFRETFSEFNTVENMNSFCNENYSAEIQEAELSNRAVFTLVATSTEAIVGYIQLRLGNTEKCVSNSNYTELWRLYVAKQVQGSGVAQTLMQKIYEHVKAINSPGLWLGVWEENQRALSFYRKFGFREVGSHVFKLGEDLQRDLIMEVKSEDLENYFNQYNSK
jgi:ribosomal protein S18 acetylase RimI-like enzyme